LFLGHGSDSLDVIAAARRVNDGMPAYVAGLLRGALGSLDGRRVAVLGIAYKGNVDDARNSPGVQLVATLRGETAAHGTEAPVQVPVTDGGDGTGPTVVVSDPHVSDPAYGVVDLETALAGADAAVIAADHDAYRDLDPERAADLMADRVIVDAKGMLDVAAWEAAGFDLIRV
jgi:UDP-N-acetyl-D-mannosaminuronic acid dehydrogenase